MIKLRFVTYYLAAAFDIAVITLAASTPPAFAQEPVFPPSKCVEAPASAVNVSSRRNGKSTNCNADARKAEAIEQARVNAAHALSSTCTAQISAQERQEICAARGLTPRPANAAGDMIGFLPIADNPDGDVDTAFPVSGTLCVVVRDLPKESTSQTLAASWGGLGDCLVYHFPFITSENRILFTARSRARCGVQCQ